MIMIAGWNLEQEMTGWNLEQEIIGWNSEQEMTGWNLEQKMTGWNLEQRTQGGHPNGEDVGLPSVCHNNVAHSRSNYWQQQPALEPLMGALQTRFLPRCPCSIEQMKNDCCRTNDLSW